MRAGPFFCDCDILFLNPINELFSLADDKYAVMCVQHDYSPKATVKMDKGTNHIQEKLSSLVLWNCGHPSNKKITKN